jgi:hypothetical protein
MDKSTKTILAIIGSVLFVCACMTAGTFATGLWSFGKLVRWADQSVSEDPQTAVRVGSEIADFDIPDGFGSPYSIHFEAVTIVAYKSVSEKSHILLAQFPEGTSINAEQMLKEIEQGSGDPNSIWYNTKTELTEQKPVIIRGQECTLNISEGTSSDGIEFGMATAKFDGKSGPALVLVAGPLDEWDDEMVEEFISSIQ